MKLLNLSQLYIKRTVYLFFIKNGLIMQQYTSWVGYAASSILVISFFFTDYNLTLFLILNSIGCFLFITYGFLLGKNWPIIIPNAFIVCLNLYKLLF